jgi:hypothetical protein
MRPATRAIRALRPPKRYASTAQLQPSIPVPIPSAVPASGVPQPLIRELEGLYEILEGQVGGDPVWSNRVLSAVELLRNPDTDVRVGGTFFPSLFPLFSSSFSVSFFSKVMLIPHP